MTPTPAPAARRIRLAIAAVGIALLSGCVLTPPGQPTDPTIGQSSQPSPSPSDDTSTSPSPTPSESTAAEAEFEYANDPDAATVWSFEPTGARVVESDSIGNVAPEGSQLVVLSIDAQLLAGSPDFYYQFTVGAFDPDTGTRIGLSSASQFYAERDLFTYGKQAGFTDAHAIYVLPDGWDISTWMFVCNETGEEWVIEDVPVS